MKLPLRAAGHEALRGELRRWDGFVSSALLAVEAVRACARYSPSYAERAREGLAGVSLLPVDDAVLELAAAIGPPALRSLDAVHLSTAIGLADDLGVVLTYDARLAEAARALALPVAAPR